MQLPSASATATLPNYDVSRISAPTVWSGKLKISNSSQIEDHHQQGSVNHKTQILGS
jgi:hypothetical protein